MTETTTTQGQVSTSAAEKFEASFVPYLTAQFGVHMANALQLAPGQSVLDVACGTGVLARQALRRVQPGGSVAGLDRNEGMLAVARGKEPGVEWRLGRAETLPYPDASFDAVGCQFGLMFFEDRAAGLREMWRVLRQGGRLAVAVWDAEARSPGYRAINGLIERWAGPKARAELAAPYALSDTQTLRSLFSAAGIPNPALRTLDGTVWYPSIRAWVETDVKGWTLADMLGDDQYRRLVAEAERELKGFEGPDGLVAFSSPAHLVSVRKT